MTLEDRAEQGFTTDQDFETDAQATSDNQRDGVEAPLADDAPPQASVVAPPADDAVVLVHEPDLSVLDVRPGPGRPREYHFPRFERAKLDNGIDGGTRHTCPVALCLPRNC